VHTLIDLRGSIPSFILITDGKYHDNNALDEITPKLMPFTSWIRRMLTLRRYTVCINVVPFLLQEQKRL